MKIAVALEHYNPEGGGAERSAHQIVESLALRGHEVTVFAGKCPEHLLRANGHHPDNHLDDDTSQAYVEDVAPPGAGDSIGAAFDAGDPRQPQWYTQQGNGASAGDGQVITNGRVSVRIHTCPLIGKLRRGWEMWCFSRWARRRLIRGAFDATLSFTMAVPARVVEPRGGTVSETLRRNVAMRTSVARRAIKRIVSAITFKMFVLQWLERRTLRDRHVHQFVALSQYVVNQLCDQLRVPASRVTMIANGSVMPRLSEEHRATWRARVRYHLRVGDDSTLYLFAAHNPRLKGFDTLANAVCRLKNQGYLPVVLLAGNIGYSQVQRSGELGVRDCMRFLGPTRRMAELFAAADVTVHPTHYDPSSKVVIESLMMGTPAISTVYNGASDLIVPAHSHPRGRVIEDPNDANTLAQAMADLADAQTRKRCKDATAGLFDQLSIERHVDALEQVLLDTGD